MNRALRFVIAALAGTLACGLPLWPIPCGDVSMPGNPSPLAWMSLGTLAGVLGGYLLRGLGLPTLAVGGGFVAAVLLRVAVETAKDPTSHNLWPFEVVIAGIFGVVSGLLGAAIARGVQRSAGTR